MERRAVPLCQLSLLLPLDAMQARYRLHYGPICLSVWLSDRHKSVFTVQFYASF